MAKAAKSQDVDEFAAAWQSWWEKFPTPKSLPQGVLRRIDVSEMMGEDRSLSSSAARSLVAAVGAAVDEILAGKATRWTPATGFIDIHYGALGPGAADLKHTILVSAVERAVRGATRDVAGKASPEGAKI